MPHFQKHVLDDTTRSVLLAAFAAGANLEDAATAANIPRATVYQWMGKDPELVAEIERARSTHVRLVAAAVEAARAGRAPVLAPPPLALVPPAPASKPKAVQSAEKASRDTRHVVRPAQVVTAIVVAADAMKVPLQPSNMPSSPPRWTSPPSWGPLRSAFHRLPDAERRECIVRLLLEEAERIAHDDAASINGRAR